MTEQELSQALQRGEAKQVKLDVQPQQQVPFAQPSTTPSIDEFIIVLSALRLTKKHLAAAPTSTPKNFLDQIQFYDDGTNRRVYFYVNKTWRFATLT
jgi:hypothetical protein